jgi:hypothetical protein
MTVAPDIVDEIRIVTARVAAVEAVTVQIVAPLLEAIEPGIARQLIDGIRASLSAPMQDDVLQLAVEEHLQRLADQIERRVRMKLSPINDP